MKNSIKKIIGASLVAMTLCQAVHASDSSMHLLQQLIGGTSSSQCTQQYGRCVAGCTMGGIGRAACYASCQDRYCNT